MGLLSGCLYFGHRLGCYFREDPTPVDGPGLEEAIEQIGKLGSWLWTVFFLISFAGMLNIWALLSNTFQAQEKPFLCDIPELKNSNWTDEEKRIITGGKKESSCTYRDYNYADLTSIPYESALAYTKNATAKEKNCEKFIFEEPETSIVAEWGMVCGQLGWKQPLLTSVSVGKFLGTLIFGPIADRWGRKRSVLIGALIYIIIGPTGVYPNWYLFLMVRFFQGFGGVGIYICGLTLLLELCQERNRVLLGVLFNQSYAVGMIILPVIAKLIPNWKHLQLTFSLPSLILLVTCWIVPESPRWLLTHNKRSEAWKVVIRCKKSLGHDVQRIDPGTETSKPSAESEAEEPMPEKTIPEKTMREHHGILQSLVGLHELRLRLVICCFLWFSLALVYYSILLSSGNFSIDPYIYTSINGAIESVSYVIPIFILRYQGRSLTSAILFLTSGICLFFILSFPQDMKYIIMICAMISRLCIGAVYSIIGLFTIELFPTINRATALGLSCSASQFACILAPFVVDLLGKVSWLIPSTICAVLSVTCFLFALLLPETRGTVLPNSVEEIENSPDKVSILNCFKICPEE